MTRFFYMEIPQYTVQHLHSATNLHERLYLAILGVEATGQDMPIVVGTAGRAVVSMRIRGYEVPVAAKPVTPEEHAPGNEPPKDGWWPEGEWAIGQTLFRKGRGIASIYKTAGGWRSYSMVEMNKKDTDFKTLTDRSAKTRRAAQKQAEDYADQISETISTGV